jgi:hypothetical protein
VVWRTAVVSAAFGLLGTVEGAAGAGAGFECVLPAAGGCAPLDLLVDFAALDTAAGAFAAEFTVLAVAIAECVLTLVPAGCAFELLVVATVFFIGDAAVLDEETGCALAAVGFAVGAGVAVAEFGAGRTSAAVVNTMSTGALGNA